MKTKNNLTTGILIGIGMIVVPLILMGTTYSNTNSSEIGRYQISTTTFEKTSYIYETTIDTKTGKVIRERRSKEYY